jgi:hypothetical protein
VVAEEAEAGAAAGIRELFVVPSYQPLQLAEGAVQLLAKLLSAMSRRLWALRQRGIIGG